MSVTRAIVGVLAVLVIAFSFWKLERAEAGILAERLGTDTPATVFYRAEAPDAPVVVIAHGFGGSRQLMRSWALTLARAGYVAVTFDFMGHGRNTTPMERGDGVAEANIDAMMAEVARVTDAALEHPHADGRLALIGHAMGSDVVIRQGIADTRVGAVVALSMRSDAVTVAAPRNLLMITGAWEHARRAEALEALKLVNPGAMEGDTVGNPGETAARRAVVAPNAERVGVLYSEAGLRATRAWLDQTFGRLARSDVHPRGPWIALMLAGLVTLAWPLAALFPLREARGGHLRPGGFALALVAPAIVAPLLLRLVTFFLPSVAAADYLALHFLVQGALMVGLLWRADAMPAGWAGGAFLALPVAIYGLVALGGALDAYVTSTLPHPARAVLVLKILPGAVVWMLAEATLTEGGRASWVRVTLVRAVLLGSVAFAVVLGPARQGLSAVALPTILGVLVVFGLVGGWVGRRTGQPLAGGIAGGVVLAWALGVTVPLVAAA